MNKSFKRFYSYLASAFFMVNQAFEMRKAPIPWIKAISAGVCAALPPLIGLLVGNLQYGLLAGIGSFTYLYIFNEPYAQRAKKLLCVLLGMSLAVGLGTLFAPLPILSAVTVGMIGAIGTFIFGALKIPGPAAIFFILGFSMATGMPIDPTLALMRGGLVFLGGVLAWLIGMAGRLIEPHGPEKKAMKGVCQELASLLESVGTEDFPEARWKTVLQMKTADDTLLAGYSSWRTSNLYKRLFLLNHQANSILLDIFKFDSQDSPTLPPELSQSVRDLAEVIENRNKRNGLKMSNFQHENEDVRHLFLKIDDAYLLMSEPVSQLNGEMKISKPSLKTVLGGALDHNSIVLLNAIRYGIVLTIAAIIAFSFDFNRSYWIILSCAAVMLGSTVMATFHRAIQRTFGTIIGILAASLILSLEPTGMVIITLIMIMTFFTELFIGKNYAIAVMFITPNALLLAESTTRMHNVSYFATTRITDIFMGCVIGLIGTILLGRRSASSRLPRSIARTIRSQTQLLLMLFSEKRSDLSCEEIREQEMQTNLTNLKILYSTALGEIPTNITMGNLRPAITSIEHIGYLLHYYLKISIYSSLSDEELAQLMLVFENMAMAAEQKQPLAKMTVPYLEKYPLLQKETSNLQEALQIFGTNK
ncbi:FUSC family protein [Bacillus sp. FSL K6-3431]|uniref:FUSC family protein n=1 Tax=Bacillus sp. FSL K6-3431 TaxID=2921500 RepID=UPI0030F85D27